MDFYNLQETDHRLLETAMERATGSSFYLKSSERYFFNFDRVLNKKSILLVEEDARIQLALRKLILEANRDAQCWAVRTLDDMVQFLEQRGCDLLIANYYTSEDEIDYEFWDLLRERFPHIEVIILSHVNDREFYQLLEASSLEGKAGPPQSLSNRVWDFFENVFGG